MSKPKNGRPKNYARRERIIAAIRDGLCFAKDIALVVGCTHNEVTADLKTMECRGIVCRRRVLGAYKRNRANLWILNTARRAA